MTLKANNSKEYEELKKYDFKTETGPVYKNATHITETEEYQQGARAENEFKEMFEADTTIELKTERGVWQRTGNAFIEVAQFSKTNNKWEKSGLAGTGADYFTVNLEEPDGTTKCYLTFPTSELVQRIKKLIRLNYIGGTVTKDEAPNCNATKGYLLPLQLLFTSNKERKNGTSSTETGEAKTSD